MSNEDEDLLGTVEDEPTAEPEAENVPLEQVLEELEIEVEEEPDLPPAKVVRDLTCRATYAGATYPKARVQVRSDGTAALFVPAQPSEPLVRFTTDLPVRIHGGKGYDSEDGEVTFAHRALGCGWNLCKSRTPSQTLAKRW